MSWAGSPWGRVGWAAWGRGWADPQKHRAARGSEGRPPDAREGWACGGGGEADPGAGGLRAGRPPDPASALCVVRPLGLVAGLAGRHHPGFPESLPQLPPGGPVGPPGPREGAAAGQADPPHLLPGGEERGHLGAGGGARPPDAPPPPPPRPGAHSPTWGSSGGPCLAPPAPRLACPPSAPCQVSEPAHRAPHPHPAPGGCPGWAPALRQGHAGASSGLRACTAGLSGGRWPGKPAERGSRL